MKIMEQINTNMLKRQVNMETFGKVYRDTGSTECSYPRHLDTYGKGCYFNCSYCYSRAMLTPRGRWNPNSPAVAQMDTVIKTIREECPKGSVIRMGGMTDCFQPREKIERVSYKTIKLLNRKGVHYLIVTKSPLILEKEYMELFDHDLAHFQISMPTTDNDFIKRVSRRVPTFEETKNMVETLYHEDFDVIIRASPFLYNLMDYDKLNSVECDKILVEFLRHNPNVRTNFQKYMDLSEYTYRLGKFNMDYKYLPLDIKLREIEKLDFKEVNICEDVPEHDRYFKKHIDYNPDSCCNLRL